MNPRINCFVGKNGAGKTNILDGVHYLSMCKSYFNSIDSQNIRHNEQFFVIQGLFDVENQEEEVYCGLKKGEKKVFKRNKKEYNRLSDHIGRYPSVMISPYDSELITEGSETRRKFLDSFISQFDKAYLTALVNYTKVLNQRNALLKQFYKSGQFQAASLDIWDEQLVSQGEIIFETRRRFLESFQPIFQKYYRWISDEASEEVELGYKSALLEEDFGTMIRAARNKDLMVQHSTVGVHRDDLKFLIHGHPIRKFGSQGQQKSFLIALKLAQYEFIKDLTGIKPLLLLDDIFDKLDELRVYQLMKLVTGEEFGQVFITDAHKERLKEILPDFKREFKVFEIEKGKVKEEIGDEEKK